MTASNHTPGSPAEPLGASTKSMGCLPRTPNTAGTTPGRSPPTRRPLHLSPSLPKPIPAAVAVPPCAPSC